MLVQSAIMGAMFKFSSNLYKNHSMCGVWGHTQILNYMPRILYCKLIIGNASGVRVQFGQCAARWRTATQATPTLYW